MTNLLLDVAIHAVHLRQHSVDFTAELLFESHKVYTSTTNSVRLR